MKCFELFYIRNTIGQAMYINADNADHAKKWFAAYKPDATFVAIHSIYEGTIKRPGEPEKTATN